MSHTDRATPQMGVLLAAMFTLAAASSVVFPLLPELQDTYDLPTWGLGVISGTAFAVGLAVQVTVAGLADRGHAKALLLAGLGLAAGSGLLFAAGTTLAVFTVARALGGVAVGMFVPAARAIAATVAPSAVAHQLGRLAAFELGGFVFGPVVGAAMAEVWGLRAPFLTFAGAAVAGLAVLAPRRLPPLPPGTASSTPSLALFRQRGVVVAALLALALFLPVGVYDALWARYLTDRGASTLFAGLSIALYGVPFVLLASTGGRVADRVGPVRAAVRSLWLIAPMTAAYGLLRAPALIAGVALFEAVAQAVAVPAAQAAMARACPPGRIAAGQGLAGATQLAGAAATAFVAAPLYGSAGPEAVFVGVATLIGVIGIVAWRLDAVGARSPAGVPDVAAVPVE